MTADRRQRLGELGIFRKLLSSATRPEVEAFVTRRVGRLLDFDRS